MAKSAETPIVNVHEAKTHLSRLLERVEAGEDIVLARAGKPIARLVPFRAADPTPKSILGALAHHDFVIPDNFDRWMEDEIADLFEGKHEDGQREEHARDDSAR